jgi:hypothetical protein
VVAEDSLGSCSIHAGKAASFVCAQCKRSYCPECLGRDEAGKSICSQCMVAINHQEKEELKKSVELDLKEKRAAEKNIPAQKFKSGKGVFYTIIAVAALGIGFNVYVLYQDRAQTAGGEVARTPAMSPQLAGIRLCRHRLTALSEAAETYHNDLEMLPKGIDDLKPRLDSLDVTRDPVSGLEYRFNMSANGGVVIQCPSPAAHGVESIQVQMGKAAVVKYAEQGQ